jgi:potassium-transporting ATPase KdpC subunit
MKKNLIISLKLLLFLTIITGVIYPLAITLISNLIFPSKSEGSMIKTSDGKIIGSELIGQGFDSAIYFMPRPSAISYNPMPSGASNWGPTSDTLKKTVDARRTDYIKINMLSEGTHVPEDAIFASASGVDPHISVENALIQSKRVAIIRKFDKSRSDKLMELINRLIEKPQFGILGEARINVLLLNIELDKL